MTPWAAAIDKLSWENDLLFIVAAGNIEARAKICYTPFNFRSYTSWS
jgi:hypothetical protein